MRSAMKVLVVCAALGAAAGTTLQALSQEPSQQPPVIRTQVSLVNLFVTVRDKSKRIVTDLKQEDFKIARTTRRSKSLSFPRKSPCP